MIFGRMVSSYFANRLSDNDEDKYDELTVKNISHQLDKISPDFNIDIKQSDYESFIDYFKKHDGWGYSISTLSRLLAIKRPDQFFCLTSANENLLMNSFGIEKSIKKASKKIIYERYWSEIIEPVRSSPWYRSDIPTNDEDEKVAWLGRVAMMDALFYEVDNAL